MPNDNQNTNTQTNQQDPVLTGNTPPVVPDFMAAASVSPTPSLSQTPTPTQHSMGIPLTVEDTQSPPSNFDITPPEPKKKFGGKKIIATILGVLILAGGILGGVVLTRQNQNINEQAANPCVDSCVAGGKGTKVCQCSCGITNDRCPKGGPADGGGGGGSEIVSCSTAGSFQCGKTPDGSCGGFCITGATKTCDEMLKQECNFEPIRGSNYKLAVNKASCPSGYQSAFCMCNISGKDQGVCFDRGFDGSNGTSNQCGTIDGSDQNGLCAVYKSGEASGGAGGIVCGTVNTYYCPNVNYTTTGQPCSLNLNNRPTNFCGTIQTDTACQGFKSTYVPCTSKPPVSTPPPTVPPTPVPTKTPTPAPGTAMCVDVKAYTETWNLLSAAQLSGLKAGNKVNFCVRGSTTQGAFTKAKFTINGTAQAETTTKRPSSDDFCQLYTIPAGTTSFSITAQIFHPTLGWK